ncbi:hypothetical protein ABMA28_001504 [Loxostege sticticalis]|uniref:Chorion peroxidase n=1 Tax=Loxostege sticticalis TaxID=481309 RepID=A0ABD0T1Z6_LOXSC
MQALAIALWCASASALTPLSAAGDDNECALYLTGPGRTSAYDYSLNLLKGNFGYEGQHTCITYDAVNQAYIEARNRIVVSQPKGDWKAEDFASVGELILDISINLARKYGLTYEEIEKGLPLIDTSRTLIREVCPPVFSHVECRAGKYRRLDGLCNNLHHPTWGATMAPFQRLIGPLFADGINAPRIAHTGRDLPLSRVVSRTMHPDEGFHDHAGTVMVIAWGQFMDHDYTLTGTPLDPVNRNDPEECCKRPPHLKHPYCNEIRVPEDDYFYRLFGVKCIDFVRGFPSPRPGCRLGSRVPFNTLTGVIDGNTVYGVTDKFARKLRTGYGGLLRMNPVFKEYGLRDLLPLKLDIPDEGCTRPNKNMYCFEAGEIRVNEQLVLTVMHTLMAREHNRVANALAEVNPHWDDETLYQEARRINIAEIQHITYNEFLPILLGKDVMEKFGLVLEKEGYWDGYDPEVNPDVIDSFAAAAYRFGHSLLPTAVERWSKAHKFIASKRLSDLIRRPYDLYRAGVLDEYVMGLMNQVAQAMDDSITQEVTNHLFKKVGARFGMDLVSFNMQRGREFGLPGYMEFRKFCGLSGADSFQDLFGTMSNETVRKYETIFEHPVDVDLWSGGVSERPLPGSMLGPTFACIIATQFSYSRRGDRFWYELPNQPSTFTPEQLTEIRKARLARVICDNTDIIDTVQLYPMVLPDHELNPRVPCRSGIIPSMDFTKWAEPAPFQGSAKQFSSESDETREKEEFRKNESGSSSVEDSREIDDDSDAPQQRNSVQKPAGSFELYEDKTYPARKSAASSTLKHSNENHGIKEEDNSKTIENSESSESSENTSRDTGRRTSPYKERKDESRETSEEDKYGSRESSHERQSNSKSDKSNAFKSQDDSRQSGENSNENNNEDDLPRPPTNERLEDNDQNAKRNNINLSTPRTIQDVDLGDFSYERVQVDDKGQIVTAQDHDENDSPVPIKPLVSPDLDQNQPPKSSSLKEEDENTHRGEFGSNKPVHINDEEVKPVVEINSELNESESHEENSNEAIKINPDENQSLETILGTKATDAEEPSNKNVEQKEPEEKADVKQQFERIPLDYKHENKQEDNENNVQSDSKDESPQEGNVNEANNEGTLDTFSPKDINYDEHLKFKFDDISIKLPEIKLPEDILAYAYEEPSYEKYEKRKDKPKSKYNQYHDEDSDDHPREQKKSRHHDDSDDDDHEYYGHSHAYGKQKQRKKGDDDEEEDEPVDLYEKFVRERFGKRGSFQKRSEKLQDAKGLPYNPKLYQTVQKLLKQTAKIDEQAKTSGDPNAGYAWTLEYGENLK